MSTEIQDEIKEILEAEVVETTDPSENTEVVEESTEEVIEETEEVKPEEVEPVLEEKPKKKPKSMEERSKKLQRDTWTMREAERKANEAADRAQGILDKLEAKQAASELIESKPLSENYDTHEDYNEALMDWKIAGNKTPVAKAKPTQAPRDDSEWQETRLDAMEAHEDFAENEGNLTKDLQFRYQTANSQEQLDKMVAEVGQITDIIIDSKDSTQLVQFLGKNRSIAKKIGRLSPMKAAIEIGMLQERLNSKPKKQITKAPRPIDKPRGGGSAPKASSNDTDAWIRQRNEQEKQGRN